MQYAVTPEERLDITIRYFGLDKYRDPAIMTDGVALSDELIYTLYMPLTPLETGAMGAMGSGAPSAFNWWEHDPIGFDIQFPLDKHKQDYLAGNEYAKAQLFAAQMSTIADMQNDTKYTGEQSTNGGTGKTPQDFLDEALSQQGLKSAPDRLKQSWTENGYEYEVRIHPAEPQYGQQGSIYRVARRLQGTDAYGQGSGWEYMDIYGNWHHTSTLKPSNPAFNSQAATDTHIPLK